jgi:hypothetical protein
MMNDTTQAAASALDWLERLQAASPQSLLRESLPRDGATTAPALATLAAEALARDRSLLVITPDDELLPDISNALDMNLRPLCLVLPGADYASRITLRATISLLKSRLSRDSDDTQGPAWRTQRTRLQEHAASWHASLDWCARSGDRDSWPENFGPLFPVRFAPRLVAESLLASATAGADWVVVIEPRAHASPPLVPWARAAATLLLTGTLTGAAAMVPVDEHARLSIELELLGQELAELELELATAQAEIGDFTRHYHELVGGRMAELDALQAEVALRRAEAAPDDDQRRQAAHEAWGQAESSREDNRRFAGQGGATDPARTAKEFRAGTDVKKLYRQIAQKIHPDRARDEADRAWRTELMAEANRAYRNADREALQEILASWQESFHAAASRPAGGSARSALALEVARLRRRVTEIESELNRLYGSRLYELFAASKVARRQGRDLLQEMADRLDGQIAAIKQALG